MDLGLKNRVALITGGSQGIGRAAAMGFSREGAKVAICARGVEALDAAAKEIQKATGNEVLAVQADVTKVADIKKFVRTAARHFSRVDILVNNGVSFRVVDNWEELTDEDWQHHINSKVMGYLRCVREVMPYMRKQRWGRIINIAGVAARATSSPSTAGATNAAVVNITRGLAGALAKDNILVNAIHPGLTRTARHPELKNGSPEELEAAKRIPIGRVIEPEDIANMMLFFASDQASAITGQTIAVDGGSVGAVFY